jgi:hypothetical protein
MSADPSSSRAGSFGRRPGVYAVPFKTDLLPGVTFVAACVKLGETIARCKSARAAVTAESRVERHAAIDALVSRIAKGNLPAGMSASSVIVTGDRGYTARETAAAIVKAIALLKSHDNARQGKRYTDRVRGECDRATGGGRAGANVIGWTDATAVNSAAAKRAANDPALAAAARDALAARSGVNSPAAVYRARVAAAAAAAAPGAKRSGAKRRPGGKLAAAAAPAAPARATGAKRRAAAPVSGTPVAARKGAAAKGAPAAAETSKAPGKGLTARRPRRPRKGA